MILLNVFLVEVYLQRHYKGFFKLHITDPSLKNIKVNLQSTL